MHPSICTIVLNRDMISYGYNESRQLSFTSSSLMPRIVKDQLSNYSFTKTGDKNRGSGRSKGLRLLGLNVAPTQAIACSSSEQKGAGDCGNDVERTK